VVWEHTSSRSEAEVRKQPSGCIVAGVEPETGADGAAVAGELAERLALELVLVHVEPAPMTVAAPHVAYAAPRLELGGELRTSRRDFEAVVGPAPIPEAADLRMVFGGDPSTRLLAAAESCGARLIALGTRRRPGWRRALFGSTVANVVSRGRCPVLVVPERRKSEIPTQGGTMRGSILCGVDGSADSQAALRAATRLAEQLGARLVVAHVVQPEQMRPVAAGARLMPALSLGIEAGERLLEEILETHELTDVERRVGTGVPADRLADLADEEDAELIVVGSRGRGAFRAAFLGSVSSDLIGVARCPVLVVPPGAAEASLT
jgi:nucleotide-binding universal stress UspA family protein